MQLTLEPYKFELCGATYAWVFFSEYAVLHGSGWLNLLMQTWIIQFLTVTQPHVVQGSMCICRAGLISSKELAINFGYVIVGPGSWKSAGYVSSLEIKVNVYVAVLSL